VSARRWRPDVSQENVDLVRAIYEAWLEGTSARHLIAKDLEYVNPTYAVESGTRRDRKALRAVRDVYPDYRVIPDRFIESGDDVVVLGTAHGTGASGVEMTIRQGFIWTVEDGRAVRMRWFNDWDEALEAAGVAE
jgi:ketosteroid isomerase-like protein